MQELMTNNFKILIVEDEMIIAADISMIISNLGYEVTGITPRGEDALKSIEATRPDLVLMDVALKGALDGVDTARMISSLHKIPVIFLTSNADDNTFNRAKEAKPFAFISKPFRQTDLQRAIELVIERISEKLGTSENIDGINTTKEAYLLKDRIFIRYKEKMLGIFLNDIQYLEADRSYSRLITAETEYLLTMPLGAFEEKLQSPEFLRIHRSYIININKIKSISDNFSHVQVGKSTLPVSKPFQETLANKLRVI